MFDKQSVFYHLILISVHLYTRPKTDETQPSGVIIYACVSYISTQTPEGD